MTDAETISLLRERVARMEGRQDSLEATVHSVKDDITQINLKLDKIISADASRVGMVKGGWWVLTIIATVVVTATGMVMAAWKHFIGG